jgi:hypothetical protein
MSLRSNAPSLALLVSVVGALAGPAEPGENNVLVTGPGAFPRDSTPRLTHSIHNPTVSFALKSAAKMALERLEYTECRKVLSDFRDASGRTIQEKLDLLGETPRSYLPQITFREGLDHRRCRNSAILAFTSVGGREVVICGQQFWQAYRENPFRVEALVIHEMLHTLGLGENPPSAMEIDARVLKRCW